MKKVLVIGCPGSGKSTFSRILRDSTHLPLYYLDQIWHNPDKTHVTEEEFQSRLDEILGKDEWIIDGNYASSLEKRLAYCDTVFYFCLSPAECLEGVRKRLGTWHEDLPWFEDKEDPEFIEYVRTFHETRIPKMEQLLENAKQVNIIRFRSREEEDDYIENNLRRLL